MLRTFLLIGSLMALSVGADAALIHHYTFDSGPVAVDSVGGANGTLFGGAAIVSQALSLNGSDAYVQTMGNHIIPTSGDFTVIFFAQQLAFGPNWVEMISQGLTGSGFYIGYDPSHNFRITDAYTSTAIPFPTDGQYHNYALAKSGANAAFYIDGIFQGNFANIAVGSGGTDTRFGRQFAPYGEFFNGYIDNVQIHDTALSANEIASIVAAGPNSTPVPTINEWGMIIFMALAGLGSIYYIRKNKKV